MTHKERLDMYIYNGYKAINEANRMGNDLEAYSINLLIEKLWEEWETLQD